MVNSKVIGADIGGTHISAALVDLHSRTLLQETYAYRHVNSRGTVDEILSAWCRAIEQVWSSYELEEKRLGLALPGPFNYEAGISLIKDNNKYEALYGLNVKNLLAERLSINPADILMKNDAACFLQGEAFSGAAKGFTQAIGLTLGTGIGTARYNQGVAVDADLWHTSFRDSILEDYLSTRWFLKRYEELCGEKVRNVKELAERFSTDDNVRIIFDEFAENLAALLEEFIRKDNPEVVVIGGSITNSAELFLPKVEKYLQRKSIYANIKRTSLGEEAPIFGGASCWYDGLMEDVYSSVNIR
jgi:glucokinase